MLDRRMPVILAAIVAFLVAWTLVVGLAVMLSACAPPAPQEPPPSPDAATCRNACANAQRLCGPAALKPKTASCDDVCKATEDGGGDFRIPCLTTAATCPAIEACSR